MKGTDARKVIARQPRDADMPEFGVIGAGQPAVR